MKEMPFITAGNQEEFVLVDFLGVEDPLRFFLLFQELQLSSSSCSFNRMEGTLARNTTFTLVLREGSFTRHANQNN